MCKIILLNLFLFFNSLVIAQSHVTGHVFAEIIDVTSISYSVNNFIVIDSDSNSEFDLGEFLINSNNSIKYEILINNSDLKGNKGNFFDLEMNKFNDDNVIKLQGKIDKNILNNIDKNYHCSYNFVLAYN